MLQVSIAGCSGWTAWSSWMLLHCILWYIEVQRVGQESFLRYLTLAYKSRTTVFYSHYKDDLYRLQNTATLTLPLRGNNACILKRRPTVFFFFCVSLCFSRQRDRQHAYRRARPTVRLVLCLTQRSTEPMLGCVKRILWLAIKDTNYFGRPRTRPSGSHDAWIIP